MTSTKTYIDSVGSMAIILTSLLISWESELRVIGVIIGIAVGIFTLVKLTLDLRKSLIEFRIKKLELKKKQSE